MSEIIELYKEDARRMIQDMRGVMTRWSDVVQGGAARQDLRRLAHQLRGSGRTYGFRDVTRICKALEQITQKLERRALVGDNRVRHALSLKIERLAVIFGT